MKNTITSIIVVFCSQFFNGQGIENVLLAANDASLLTQNYLEPGAKGLMYSMNGGWATTAKVHKKFGFDLTIGLNASFVPDAAKYFDFKATDYNFVSSPNGQTKLPTLMNEDDRESILNYTIPYGDGLYKVGNIEMPGGIVGDLPINAVPAPTVQIGFGLPFHTDIKARFVPEQTYDDVTADLFGLGLQHEITPYFGPMKKLPLSISLLGAFTNMNVLYAISDDEPMDDVEVRNGKIKLKMSTWTVQALASLNFKIITLYGGVGYNSGSTTVNMKGEYELTYQLQDEQGNYIGNIQEFINDPINLDFKTNGMRATLGTRLNLGFFKLFGDYTFQEYNTATVGLAISIR